MKSDRENPETWTTKQFRAWVRKLRKGDAVAQTQFVEWFRKRSYCIAVYWLRDDGLAQDACQNTFTQVWEQLLAGDLGSFEDLAKRMYWVVRSRAIDLARDRSRRLEGEKAFAKEFVRRVELNTESTDLRWLEPEEAWAAMNRLADDDREILVMYYQGNLSLAEIAACLDIEVVAVRQRLCRARDRLRDILGMPRPNPRPAHRASATKPPGNESSDPTEEACSR